MKQHRWATDDKRNARIFTELARKYGTDPRALDWGSRTSQFKRFAVLAGIANLRGKSVLDVGCGQGDLYGWFKQESTAVRYTGIDITPEMIEVARKRFPRGDFRRHDILADGPRLGKFDVAICSGIFTHRRTAPFEFLKAIVERMFALSRIGVAFNSLSGWAEVREGREFHADPLRVLTFCRGLSPRVVLRHDYHPRDFTVYVYRTETND